MTLQTRLTALAQAVGADIKELREEVDSAESPPEIHVGPNAPSADEILWLDTDEPSWSGPPLFVTALPTSPVNGQEVYLQTAMMATAGVVWHMRYNGVKWDFVGGAPISHRMEGASAAWAVFSNGTNVTINAAQSTLLAWNLTPPIDVWAEVEFHIGAVQKTDAAYHYCAPTMIVAPAPPIGSPAQVLKTQHASVQTFEPYRLSQKFGLVAGVAYAIYVQFSIQGGGWQYHQGSNYLHMTGKAWPR